eukprot:COSAG01_NODE_10154_length_2235_cov_4.282776_1_plen_36_part_00
MMTHGTAGHAAATDPTTAAAPYSCEGGRELALSAV